MEALLKSRALIWMERFLGVEGAEDATYVWNATIGKWTHEWLAAGFGVPETFVALPGADEFAARVSAAAERKRTEVRELCRLAGRTIPDWWDSGWENALCLAQTLGRIVGAIEGWKWAAAEWRLESATHRGRRQSRSSPARTGRRLVSQNRCDADVSGAVRSLDRRFQNGQQKIADSEKPEKR